VEVVTASQAVDELIMLVNDTNLDRKNKQPLIATLKAASASFERGEVQAGLNQLRAFENKVRSQLTKSYPTAAEVFTEYAKQITDCVNDQIAISMAE
jgi:TRAP-type mannitol/chloroaromatic compound transport system substrate-binding protein